MGGRLPRSRDPTPAAAALPHRTSPALVHSTPSCFFTSMGGTTWAWCLRRARSCRCGSRPSAPYLGLSIQSSSSRSQLRRGGRRGHDMAVLLVDLLIGEVGLGDHVHEPHADHHPCHVPDPTSRPRI